MAKKKSEHYVNNAEFSQAVVDYVTRVNEAENSNTEIPKVPNYIAQCFMKIAEGLSHRDNFSRYTYREEMVMDAVENCLKAIKNYDVEAATRSGKPNAFSYFTTISWYAFLRRIEKEKKQQDIKMKYMTSAGVEAFATVDHSSAHEASVSMNYVDMLRSRIDQVKDHDRALKEFESEQKEREKKKRAAKLADSNLSDHFGEDDD